MTTTYNLDNCALLSIELHTFLETWKIQNPSITNEEIFKTLATLAGSIAAHYNLTESESNYFVKHFRESMRFIKAELRTMKKNQKQE